MLTLSKARQAVAPARASFFSFLFFPLLFFTEVRRTDRNLQEQQPRRWISKSPSLLVSFEDPAQSDLALAVAASTAIIYQI